MHPPDEQFESASKEHCIITHRQVLRQHSEELDRAWQCFSMQDSTPCPKQSKGRHEEEDQRTAVPSSTAVVVGQTHAQDSREAARKGSCRFCRQKMLACIHVTSLKALHRRLR